MAEISYFKMLLFTASLLAGSEADTEVSCVFRENCLLPCQVQFDSDPLVHWMKVSAGDAVVHAYNDSRDQLGYQDQNFKNRTSLFQDQISRGNASLLLKGVKINDEGRYKCNSSTTRGFTESFVNLKTEAPVSNVSIYYREENRITCSSEGIYPRPELTWSTIPPSSTALETRTRVQQTEDQLYNISSSLMVSVSDPDLSYSCTIRTRSNNMTAAIRKPGNSQPAGGLTWKVILGLIGAGIKGAVIRYLHKRCKKKKTVTEGSNENQDFVQMKPSTPTTTRERQEAQEGTVNKPYHKEESDKKETRDHLCRDDDPLETLA